MKGFVRRHPFALLLLVTVLMLAAFPRLLDTLSERQQAPRPGALLVARPGGVEGPFRETVVLLVEVDARHVWGLVLNRPRPGMARWGGPVDPEVRSTLVRAQVPPEGARRVLEGLYWREGAPREGLPPEATLTFTGFAGWAPEQLAEELARGDWHVVEGSAELAFAPSESLWADCLARHL